MWLFFWKTKATTWDLWLQHCEILWIVCFGSCCGFMTILALGMWCLKRANMQQMMIKFLWVWLSWMWKNLKLICKKTITWTKKSRKGKHEWEKACIESKKTTLEIETHVKTRFVSKVIMFEETLKFKQVMLCYGR